MDYRQPLVALFMTTFGQWDGKSSLSHPKPADEKELALYKLRLKLCVEETFELFEAMLTSDAYAPFKDLLNIIDAKIDALTMDNMDIDPVGVYDSLVDQDYVNIGLANYLNLDMEAGFDEVQRSNMSKLGIDGLPVYREDGKVLKGPDYFAPNLKKVYEETR